MNVLDDNYQGNADKVIDIIKELKSTHTGCYIDKICDVAETKNRFENTATKSYLYFSITPVKDVNIDKEDSIVSVIAKNPQDVASESAVKSTLKEGRNQNLSDILDNVNLNNYQKHAKNSTGHLLFQLVPWSGQQVLSVT